MSDFHCEYLQRGWHASKERLSSKTPGSVPFRDLLMFQLLRPVFRNLSCLFSTFHLEYLSIPSRFCFLWWYLICGFSREHGDKLIVRDIGFRFAIIEQCSLSPKRCHSRAIGPFVFDEAQKLSSGLVWLSSSDILEMYLLHGFWHALWEFFFYVFDVPPVSLYIAFVALL